MIPVCMVCMCYAATSALQYAALKIKEEWFPSRSNLCSIPGLHWTLFKLI
jgi:hypothetical protein